MTYQLKETLSIRKSKICYHVLIQQKESYYHYTTYFKKNRRYKGIEIPLYPPFIKIDNFHFFVGSNQYGRAYPLRKGMTLVRTLCIEEIITKGESQFVFTFGTQMIRRFSRIPEYYADHFKKIILFHQNPYNIEIFEDEDYDSEFPENYFPNLNDRINYRVKDHYPYDIIFHYPDMMKSNIGILSYKDGYIYKNLSFFKYEVFSDKKICKNLSLESDNTERLFYLKKTRKGLKI